MPVFRLHHITKYEYDRPVRESVNEIKIYPFACSEQETLSHEILITGQPDLVPFFDYWKNKTGVFNLLPLHREMIIESKLLLRTTGPAEFAVNLNTGIDDLHNET